MTMAPRRRVRQPAEAAETPEAVADATPAVKATPPRRRTRKPTEAAETPGAVTNAEPLEVVAESPAVDEQGADVLASVAAPDGETEGQPTSGPAIPEILPVLPLRGGTVIFPLAVVPLMVGQERSVKLIDDVMRG